MEKGKFYLLHV